jgi:hypothetical protein
MGERCLRVILEWGVPSLFRLGLGLRERLGVDRHIRAQRNAGTTELKATSLFLRSAL